MSDARDGADWDAVEREIAVLKAEWEDGWPFSWERFERWLRSEALSQEMFGEYLSEEAPGAIAVAWYAFLAGG